MTSGDDDRVGLDRLVFLDTDSARQRDAAAIPDDTTTLAALPPRGVPPGKTIWRSGHPTTWLP